MGEKRYELIFSGKLVEGTKPQQVLIRLAEELKLEAPQVRELFKSGFGAVILNDIDAQEAYSTRERLREAGAICTVREIAAPPPQEPLSGVMLSIEPQSRPLSRPSDFSQDPRLQSRMQPVTTAEKQGPGIVAWLLVLLLLAGLAGGGWWGYRTYFAPPSAAFQAYSQYAESMAKGDYRKAEELGTGSARELASYKIRLATPSPLNLNPQPVSQVAGEVAWIKYKRKSEQKSADGSEVQIAAEQSVCRNMPGVSTECKAPVIYQHEVELQLLEGAWKVAGFKEERLSPPQ